MAEQIRVELARQKCSLPRLSRDSGIGIYTLRRRMHAESAFDTDELASIAWCLSVPVNRFLPGEWYPPREDQHHQS